MKEIKVSIHFLAIQTCLELILSNSVQAEIFLLPAPTFLEGLYLNFHMPGHFFLYEVVYAYPSGPLARLHKNRTKRL